MGCAQSIISPTGVDHITDYGFMKRKRSTITSVASLESLEAGAGSFGAIHKRYGAPPYFKMDGYDLGLRVRV
jgi:hypothetical protein